MLGPRMRSSITVLVFEYFLNSLDLLFSSIISFRRSLLAAARRHPVCALVFISLVNSSSGIHTLLKNFSGVYLAKVL